MCVAHTCVQIHVSLGWGHSKETPEEAVTGDRSPFGERVVGSRAGSSSVPICSPRLVRRVWRPRVCLGLARGSPSLDGLRHQLSLLL